MKGLIMSVKNVGLGSIHNFNWNWRLEDLDSVKKNNKTVFSCFSCGGGSSMGYKLAGYTVFGNCEIDPRVNAVYKANNHPFYSFDGDIRDFLSVPDEDLPQELFSLDILDGSPPCSVFSMAGKREDGWGREKVFREGQAEQRLDDLFFYFIDVAEKLKPKIVIAENVKGLVLGNAKGYVNLIIKKFNEAGYDVQVFLLNSALMGVPQARERVFFVARQTKLCLKDLEMSFSEKPIRFGEIRSETGGNASKKDIELLKKRKYNDKSIADINLRIKGKNIGFTSPILSDSRVAPTLTSAGKAYRMFDGMPLSVSDIKSIQTFPQDYDFGKEDPKYIAGMSVPPVMMAQVANEVYKQWLKGIE